MLQRLMFLLLGLLLWGTSGVASALEPRLWVVQSDTSLAYQQATEGLLQALAREGVDAAEVAVLSVPAFQQRSQNRRPSALGAASASQRVVTLGAAAAEAVLAAKGDYAVLSVLVPRQSFERMLRVLGKSVSTHLSALYIDQPLVRQFALLRLVWPQANRLGVLLGPDSASRLLMLRRLATPRQWQVNDARVVDAQDLFSALSQVLDGSDVLLALADPLVFNRSSIQNILLASYRARVPMLAFSPAYVRAGAVLALYTAPLQAGQQAGRLAAQALRTERWPEQAQEPDDFVIEVNPSVARSLGLSLEPDSLRLQLRTLERLP